MNRFHARYDSHSGTRGNSRYVGERLLVKQRFSLSNPNNMEIPVVGNRYANSWGTSKNLLIPCASLYFGLAKESPDRAKLPQTLVNLVNFSKSKSFGRPKHY